MYYIYLNPIIILCQNQSLLKIIPAALDMLHSEKTAAFDLIPPIDEQKLVYAVCKILNYLVNIRIIRRKSQLSSKKHQHRRILHLINIQI